MKNQRSFQKKLLVERPEIFCMTTFGEAKEMKSGINIQGKIVDKGENC